MFNKWGNKFKSTNNRVHSTFKFYLLYLLNQTPPLYFNQHQNNIKNISLSLVFIGFINNCMNSKQTNIIIPKLN